MLQRVAAKVPDVPRVNSRAHSLLSTPSSTSGVLPRTSVLLLTPEARVSTDDIVAAAHVCVFCVCVVYCVVYV